MNSMNVNLSFAHKSFSDKQINQSLNKILKSNVLFSMASIKESNESWINTAYFAYSDKLTFYFLTPPTAQHSKNVEENNSVAVSIFDSRQVVTGKKRGLQIFGICRRAKGEEIYEGIKIYGKRFSAFAAGIKRPEDFETNKMESRVYVIVPHTIKIFDEVIFGEEKWVTVTL